MEVDLLDGRFKVRHLVLALAVAEQGGFTKAAGHLHVTQPVITRGIRELEDLLGVELFDRRSKQALPTQFGRIFLDHARAVLRYLRETGRQAAEASEGVVGTVTVASHLAGSNFLLPRAIILLKTELPRVKVVVRDGTPESLAAELASGEIDLIVGRKGQVRPEFPVQHVDLYEEPFRIAARKGHPALFLSNPALDELLGYPWILPVAQTSLRTELEDLFQRRASGLPADVIECGLPTTVRTILKETDYLAVMPESIATADSGLVILATPLEGVSQRVVATLPSEFTQTKGAQTMLRCLVEASATIGSRE